MSNKTILIAVKIISIFFLLVWCKYVQGDIWDSMKVGTKNEKARRKRRPYILAIFFAKKKKPHKGLRWFK